MAHGGRLHVAVIGGARFGIGQPFAGGLEAHTATLASALLQLGHRVTVYAGCATDEQPAGIEIVPILERAVDFTGQSRIDNAMPPERWQREDLGYRRVLTDIGQTGRFDIVHNNSLHYLPPVLDGALSSPMVHTLHTPPFAHLAQAHRYRAARRSSGSGAVVAVSESLASQWAPLVSEVVPNGVPLEDWPEGGGTDREEGCVWAGRLVPEKAPHLAIDAAREAGRSIVLAGPVQHPAYFDTVVRPRLGADASWVGHLRGPELAALYGQAAVGVVTPCWDEPFGLVAAEMLACGTPVAAFDRGAMAELLQPGVGMLAPPGDVGGLGVAINGAARLSRRVCRKHAVAHLSAVAMAERYVGHYRATLAGAGR